jgi:hypothetical protein
VLHWFGAWSRNLNNEVDYDRVWLLPQRNTTF